MPAKTAGRPLQQTGNVLRVRVQNRAFFPSVSGGGGSSTPVTNLDKQLGKWMDGGYYMMHLSSTHFHSPFVGFSLAPVVCALSSLPSLFQAFLELAFPLALQLLMPPTCSMLMVSQFSLSPLLPQPNFLRQMASLYNYFCLESFHINGNFSLSTVTKCCLEFSL